MRVEEISRLSNAIKSKNYNAIYDLIAKPNFDVNQIGCNDHTPLLCAVKHGDIIMTETFLKMGANPNSGMTTVNGYTPVLHVALNNTSAELRLKLVTLLLQYGAREKENLDGGTALHLAVMQADIQCAKQLVVYGFNPKSWNKSKFTPIDIARSNNLINIVNMLENASTEHISLTKIVLAKVINPEYFRFYQQVFFQMRRDLQLPNNVMLLIQFFFFYRPASLEKTNNRLVKAVEINDILQVQSAFQEGYIVDDNVVHNHKNTPLEIAVKNDNIPLVKILLKYSILSNSASRDAKNQEIKDILIATKRKQLAVLKEALKLEAKDPAMATL